MDLSEVYGNNIAETGTSDAERANRNNVDVECPQCESSLWTNPVGDIDLGEGWRCDYCEFSFEVDTSEIIASPSAEHYSVDLIRDHNRYVRPRVRLCNDCMSTPVMSGGLRCTMCAARHSRRTSRRIA